MLKDNSNQFKYTIRILCLSDGQMDIKVYVGVQDARKMNCIILFYGCFMPALSSHWKVEGLARCKTTKLDDSGTDAENLYMNFRLDKLRIICPQKQHIECFLEILKPTKCNGKEMGVSLTDSHVQ